MTHSTTKPWFLRSKRHTNPSGGVWWWYSVAPHQVESNQKLTLRLDDFYSDGEGAIDLDLNEWRGKLRSASRDRSGKIHINVKRKEGRLVLVFGNATDGEFDATTVVRPVAPDKKQHETVGSSVDGPNRVCVLVDGSNIYHAQQNLGWWVDWGRFRDWVSANEGRPNISAHYFDGFLGGLDWKFPFLQKLPELGYSPHTKPVKFIANGNGKAKPKCNFDVEMTLCALDEAPYSDTFYLVTGDSDLAPLVVRLKSLDKKVVVVSGKNQLSHELASSADGVIHLEDLKSAVRREPHRFR